MINTKLPGRLYLFKLHVLNEYCSRYTQVPIPMFKSEHTTLNLYIWIQLIINDVSNTVFYFRQNVHFNYYSMNLNSISLHVWTLLKRARFIGSFQQKHPHVIFEARTKANKGCANKLEFRPKSRRTKHVSYTEELLSDDPGAWVLAFNISNYRNQILSQFLSHIRKVWELITN